MAATSRGFNDPTTKHHTTYKGSAPTRQVPEQDQVEFGEDAVIIDLKKWKASRLNRETPRGGGS